MDLLGVFYFGWIGTVDNFGLDRIFVPFYFLWTFPLLFFCMFTCSATRVFFSVFLHTTFMEGRQVGGICRRNIFR